TVRPSPSCGACGRAAGGAAGAPALQAPRPPRGGRVSPGKVGTGGRAWGLWSAFAAQSVGRASGGAAGRQERVPRGWGGFTASISPQRHEGVTKTHKESKPILSGPLCDPRAIVVNSGFSGPIQ